MSKLIETVATVSIQSGVKKCMCVCSCTCCIMRTAIQVRTFWLVLTTSNARFRPQTAGFTVGVRIGFMLRWGEGAGKYTMSIKSTTKTQLLLRVCIRETHNWWTFHFLSASSHAALPTHTFSSVFLIPWPWKERRSLNCKAGTVMNADRHTGRWSPWWWLQPQSQADTSASDCAQVLEKEHESQHGHSG